MNFKILRAIINRGDNLKDKQPYKKYLFVSGMAIERNLLKGLKIGPAHQQSIYKSHKITKHVLILGPI